MQLKQTSNPSPSKVSMKRYTNTNKSKGRLLKAIIAENKFVGWKLSNLKKSKGVEIYKFDKKIHD